MEFEDSRNALFSDPNAYIVKPKNKDNCKKVVFAEPYENVPNFYINNNFKKLEKCNCDCNSKTDLNKTFKENKLKNSNFLSGLNLQSLMPILSMFGGGNIDFSKLTNFIKTDSQSGIIPLITSLLSNKELPSMLNMFNNSNSKQKTKKEIKSTDYEINSYTRVE